MWTKVAALLDSCLRRFGRCFMKPRKMSKLFAVFTHMTSLTDFPETSTQLLVLVELPSKLIAVVKHNHESQQVLGRDRVVDFVVPKEVVRRLDEKQLQHTFDNDLLENTPSFAERNLSSGLFLVTSR